MNRMREEERKQNNPEWGTPKERHGFQTVLHGSLRQHVTLSEHLQTDGLPGWRLHNARPDYCTDQSSVPRIPITHVKRPLSCPC